MRRIYSLAGAVSVLGVYGCRIQRHWPEADWSSHARERGLERL